MRALACEATDVAWQQLLALIDLHGPNVNDAILIGIEQARGAGNDDAAYAWYEIGAALLEYGTRPARPN